MNKVHRFSLSGFSLRGILLISRFKERYVIAGRIWDLVLEPCLAQGRQKFICYPHDRSMLSRGALDLMISHILVKFGLTLLATHGSFEGRVAWFVNHWGNDLRFINVSYWGLIRCSQSPIMRDCNRDNSWIWLINPILKCMINCNIFRFICFICRFHITLVCPIEILANFPCGFIIHKRPYRFSDPKVLDLINHSSNDSLIFLKPLSI